MIDARARLAAARRPPIVELLVDVLDDDDRGVDHGADGDGDAAERHDVGGQVLVEHRDEREQHGDAAA